MQNNFTMELADNPAVLPALLDANDVAAMSLQNWLLQWVLKAQHSRFRWNKGEDPDYRQDNLRKWAFFPWIKSILASIHEQNDSATFQEISEKKENFCSMHVRDFLKRLWLDTD